MSYEIVGIIASFILILSFLQKDERKLRMINIVGTIMYIIYGFLINALSVWFLNIIILCINGYRLYQKK